MKNRIKTCTKLENCPDIPLEVLEKNKITNQENLIKTCTKLENCPDIPLEVLEKNKITNQEIMLVLSEIERRRYDDNKKYYIGIAAIFRQWIKCLMK